MQWFDLGNLAFLVLIWCAIGYRWRTVIKGRKYWVAFFFVFTWTEILSFQLSSQGDNNLWVYHWGRALQFVLLLFYFREIMPSARWVHLVVAVTALVTCVWFLGWGDMQAYGSLEVMAYGAILTFCCALYFNVVIRARDPVELNMSDFWYVVSIFIFFGGGLCLHAPLDYMIAFKPEMATKLFNGIIFNWYILYVATLYAVVSSRSL